MMSLSCCVTNPTLNVFSNIGCYLQIMSLGVIFSSPEPKAHR